MAAAFGSFSTYVDLSWYKFSKQGSTYLPTYLPTQASSTSTYLPTSTYLQVALGKVRYRVRHFGGVFTFPVVSGRFPRLVCV